MSFSARKIIGGSILLLLVIDLFVFDFLSYPRNLILKGALRVSRDTELIALEKENAELALRIEDFERAVPLASGSLSLSPASLYSTYPFNDKSLATIAMGAREETSQFDPVFVMQNGKPFLFGQIIDVFENRSVVRTIFDSEWRTAVRVGENRTNALLQGGNPPRITLIAKSASLTKGDEVYTASPDFPYGIRLGSLGTVFESKDGFWGEADLELPYVLSDIETVFVLKGYNQK